MLGWLWRHGPPGPVAAFQRSLTYYPDRTRPTPAESDVPELAPVTLETEDGLALLAWHAPPRIADLPSLIYFHGNAGHIGMRGFKVRAYLNAGLGVLLTTYRGYSGNPGTPTEDGLYADGRAARAFLRARAAATPGRFSTANRSAPASQSTSRARPRPPPWCWKRPSAQWWISPRAASRCSRSAP